MHSPVKCKLMDFICGDWKLWPESGASNVCFLCSTFHVAVVTRRPCATSHVPCSLIMFEKHSSEAITFFWQIDLCGPLVCKTRIVAFSAYDKESNNCLLLSVCDFDKRLVVNQFRQENLYLPTGCQLLLFCVNSSAATLGVFSACNLLAQLTQLSQL